MDDEGGGQLVVEGWVNNVDNRVLVRLNTSTVEGVGSNTLGIGASVNITIGADHVVTLEETFPGSYANLSEPIFGAVGESYQLNIQLMDGSVYQSEVETIPEPVALGSIKDEFIENRGVTDDDVPFVSYSHDIFVALENTPQQHFVRIETRGWSNLRVDYEFEPAGPLTCWQLQDPINREVILASNNGITGNFYDRKVANIPVDFRASYVVDVFANAMSREAFTFWTEAQRQLNRGGGVFDPPFAPIISNIRNVDDPDELVLGYFHAYSQTMNRYCYSRVGLQGNFEIPIIPNSVTLCTDIHAPAVFELPFDDAICP